MPRDITVNRTPFSNRFCGPAALAMVTGKHVDYIVDWVLNRRRAEAAAGIKSPRTFPTELKKLTGMWDNELLAFLEAHDVLPVKVPGLRKSPDINLKSWKYLGRSLNKYTLATVLELLRHRRVDDVYIISPSNHYIVLQGGKIYDNNYPLGMRAEEWFHRRTEVSNVWLCLPAPEGWEIPLREQVFAVGAER